MDIVDRLIAALDEDAPVREVYVGVYWTAVVSRRCGLASTLVDDRHPHTEAPVRDAGTLTGRTALELVSLARSGSPLEASIGVAAINSLLQVDETRCVELNAADLIQRLGANRAVAIVGHFPFVSRLRGVLGDLSVIEKQPQPGDLPAEAAAEILPRADVVAITGSSFINGTLEGLLRLCRPEATVIVLGPSTPISPVLFDYGVSVVSGTVVVDPQVVLRYVAQGASFRQIRGVRLLTMVSDPQLLGRG